MRAVRVNERKFQAEIISLTFPQSPGICGRGTPQNGGGQARVALLLPIEIPVGTTFLVENADARPLCARAMGCVLSPAGRFLVLGSIEA